MSRLTGTIPDVISQLGNLVFCDLGYNRLNGSIPAGIGAMTSLQYVPLSSAYRWRRVQGVVFMGCCGCRAGISI